VISQICEPHDLDEFVRRLVFGISVGNDDMYLCREDVCDERFSQALERHFDEVPLMNEGPTGRRSAPRRPVHA
jgi:hypothetical protein